MVGDGRVHVKDIFGPHLVEKMATTKININLQKWLFQSGRIIINAIWQFSAITSKHRIRI